MRRWFRLHPEDDDPERLLEPGQTSEPWQGTIYGRCDKCGGEGETEHECESCRAGADPHCPVCGGEVRYRGECPACEGSGRIDDRSREGVSVFPDEEGLYRYMLKRDAELSGAVVLELEGSESRDEDFDADEGALLVHPERIVDRRPVDEELLRRVRAELGR